MPSSIDNYLGVHAAALKLRSQRTEVLAANLANADTPGYRARDIDFKHALAAATGQGGGVHLATTSAGHIGAATANGTAAPELKYRVPLAPAVRIWSTSELARYLPGVIWQVVGRIYLVKPYGVRGSHCSASQVLELVIFLLANMLVAVACLVWLGIKSMDGLAERWIGHYSAQREVFDGIGGDLIGAFRYHAEAGRIEILTSNATHGYHPLLLHDRCGRAQVRCGVATSERHLGWRPKGAWLPECAYRPPGPWRPPAVHGDERPRRV